MPLLLPEGHPFATSAAPKGGRRLRVGIINIMPRMEAYEPLLLGPLERHVVDVEPVFVRLESHAYQSSDHDHLARHYRPLATRLGEGPLDGLILTGAPVEELAFEAVHYWRELSEVLEHARAAIPSTLGLCWGGMALGALLGIPKVPLPKKLFGVFEDRVLRPDSWLVQGQGATFRCAHSRHSGVADEEIERAARAGIVTPLSHSPDTGHSLFETPDRRFVAHLGHPEYVADRLVFEWRRDRDLGRTDVEAPRSFDPDRPETTWEGHRETLWSQWLTWLGEASDRSGWR